MVKSKFVRRKKKSVASSSTQPENPVQLHTEAQGGKRVVIATGSSGSSVLLNLKPRVILRPRLVNFQDLHSMFPSLMDIFEIQDLESFLSNYGRYYPNLVQELYGNIHVKDEACLTAVKGKFIHICPETFYKALKIPMSGAVYGQYAYSLQMSYIAMTARDYEGEDCTKINLNANSFPPLQRLIHHIITTMIYPKGGSRDQVTLVHKFIFYCLFNGVPFSLPHLMTKLIKGCADNNKRGLPYATQLTKVFAESGIELKGEPFIDLRSVDVYTCGRIKRFMHFVQKEGRVFRTLETGEFSDGFEEDDFVEGQQAPPVKEAEEAPPVQEAEETPSVKHKKQKKDSTFEHGQSSSSSTVEDRLLAYGEQLTALRSDVNQIGNDVQTMNTKLETILHHVELQSKLYQEFASRSQAAPNPDESEK
jgi:hypothetical protein